MRKSPHCVWNKQAVGSLKFIQAFEGLTERETYPTWTAGELAAAVPAKGPLFLVSLWFGVVVVLLTREHRAWACWVSSTGLGSWSIFSHLLTQFTFFTECLVRSLAHCFLPAEFSKFTLCLDGSSVPCALCVLFSQYVPCFLVFLTLSFIRKTF